MGNFTSYINYELNDDISDDDIENNHQLIRYNEIVNKWTSIVCKYYYLKTNSSLISDIFSYNISYNDNSSSNREVNYIIDDDDNSSTDESNSTPQQAEYEYMIDEDLVAIDIGYKENLYFEDEYFINQIDSYGGVDGIVVS